MRTILLAPAFLLFLSSCNSDKSGSTGTSSMTQKNLDASHTVIKAFDTGDVNGIDSAVASDFVDHTDMGDKNRDGLKAMIKMVHENNDNTKTEIIKELADDDYVFSLLRFTGTSKGKMRPAGPYDMRSIGVVKFKDGKVVEHWAYMEMAEMMKMMHGMDKKMGMGADSIKMKK